MINDWCLGIEEWGCTYVNDQQLKSDSNVALAVCCTIALLVSIIVFVC